MGQLIEQRPEGTSLQRVPYYLDEDGDLVAFDDTNKHHAFWEKDIYRGGFEVAFRGVHAWYFRMRKTTHADLHASVNPPMKPNARLMHSLVDVANDVSDLPQLVQFEQVIEHLEGEARKTYNRAHAKLAGRICSSLLEQQPFLQEGIVTPYVIGGVA